MSASRLNTEQLGRAFASSADAPASRSAERRRRIVILAWCTTGALAIGGVIGLSVWQGVQEKKMSRNLDIPLQSVQLDGFISNPSGDLQMRKMNNVLMAGAVASAASLGMCADAFAQSSAVQWTTASGGNGHWYALCEEAIPLSRAEIMAAAAAKGAQPIMLATKAEELFVYAQFGFTLLGNSADAGSSAFTWMADPGNTYSNWGTGACSSGPYPNNPTNNERFAYLQSAPCPGTQNIATQWDDYQLSEFPSSLRILFEWSADCNSDGIVDYGQILSGQLIDANSNGIPDCCDQGVACVAFNYPVQWHVNDGGNDHWYVVDTVLRSWMAARDAATSRGAHLGVITSAAEQAFVATSVYRLTSFADTWLGASRPSCSETFNWVTDEPFAGAPSGTSFLTDCVGWSGPGNFVEHIIRNSSALGWETESNDANIGNYALYEWSADCNADGIVDYGQILSGQLSDTNGDGIPDVCKQLVPIHQFDFDTDLHDSVGAATGQFKGNCRVENGALIADGNNSYVEFDQYLIPSTGSVTVAMWVKSEPAQGIHELISQGFNTNNFFLGRNYLETDRFRVGDQWFQTNTPYDWICGAWHHVAVVVNRATDRTQLWVDAQLKEERMGAITIPSIGLKTRLCAQYCCGEFFRGKLDQLRIYSSALTGPTLAEIVATSGYPCPGDISGNNSVDGVDLAALLGTWGTNGQGEFDCDIDNDGIVGGPDLTIILGGWGPCPN